MKLRILLLSFSIVFAPIFSTWSENWNVELVGRHPFGPVLDIYTVGRYAYLCAGGSLIILDIINPSKPVEIGRIDMPVFEANGVYVLGDYAYVVSSDGGISWMTIGTGSLRVLDVSDPANPYEIACQEIPYSARDVYVAKGYAYVAAGDFHVIDVSDPTNPQKVGFYSTFGSSYGGVHVVANYAYVTNIWGNEELHVIDVSDPTDLYKVSVCRTSVPPKSVYVVGNYAYVAAAGLRVIDISDAEHPKEVGSLMVGELGRSEGIYVADSYAYVTASRGLGVVDISHPEEPHLVGFYDTSALGDGASEVHIVDGYAYLAVGRAGLQVIDVSDPANPEGLGAYDIADHAFGVYVSGGVAYVADNAGGLLVVDVSDPSHTDEVGFYDNSGDAFKVHVVGNYAYVADWSAGLRVIDISDPANPNEVGSCFILWAVGIHVAKGYAYVAAGDFHVIDVSDPTNPQEVGSYDILERGGVAYGVYAAGNYAYVADGGLRVMDVSDPTNPNEVGFSHGAEYDVYVIGDYAYLADGDAGLRIIDISDPTNLKTVGREDTPGSAHGIYVVGNYAYVADWRAGLRVIDISDPTSPYEIGFYHTGSAQDVYATESYVYVADEQGGLIILRQTGTVPYTAPNIVLSQTEYHLPDIVGILNVTFMISNIGYSDLELDSIVSDNPAFEIASPSFPQTIPPNETTNFSIDFSLEQTGTSGGTLTIYSNDPDQPKAYISIIGKFLSTKRPPAAALTFSPESPAVNRPIIFDASASNDSDGQIVSYEWEFGDGSVGTGEIAEHSYSSEGQYAVILKVTDNDGKTANTDAQIVVTSGSKLHFAIDDKVKAANTMGAGLRIHKDSPVGETVKVVPDGWGFGIVGGPQNDVNDHNWWEIQEEAYEFNPVRGWVAEDYLQIIPNDSLIPGSVPEYFMSAQQQVEDALEWAENQIGKVDWSEWCLKFVREALDGDPIEGWDSAEAARQKLEQAGEFYPLSFCFNPPRGALLFFSVLGENAPYGHVGIYLGDQGIIHSYGKVRIDIEEDSKSKGIVTVANSLSTIDSYLGWSYPPEKWFTSQKPQAFFTHSPQLNELFSGQETTFMANESENIASYKWDFGDGKTDAGSIVRHRFEGEPDKSNTYVVTLAVEDTSGFTDTSETSITVIPIEKSAEVVYEAIVGEPTTIGAKVWYNWVGTDQGKNVYKISKIDDWNSYFVGYYDISIESKDRTLWTKRIIATPVQGEPYAPEQLLIAGDEDWLSVQVYGVTEQELLSTIFIILGTTGVPTGPATSPLFVETATTYLAPDYVDTSGFPAVDEKDMEIAPLTIAHIGSPVELRIYDSDGRVTGLVNGEAKREIPDSAYYNDTVVILSAGNSYRYELVGTEEGKYELGVLSVEDEKSNAFVADDIPISQKAVHQYSIDWVALTKGEEGVTIEIDEDGDSVSEKTITSDKELTQDEYLFAIAVNPKGKYPTSWANVRRTMLFQNYPNPFNPDTWIPYTLSEQADVVIRIYTATGRLVRILNIGKRTSGIHISKDKAAYWNGHDDNGETMSSGVYFYTFQAGDYVATKKMIVAE